jgi:carbon monoxide dehydrogenase subunit G
MRRAQAKIKIDRPAEEVFDYLLDIASRAEFAPEIFRELRLVRIESKGVGAGSRFRLHRKLRDRYAGTTITEAVAGERILEEGSTGRGGRVGMAIEFLLEGGDAGPTTVTWTIETYPLNPVDKLRELRMRSQLRRRMRRGLKRLRAILEGAPEAAPAGGVSVGGMDRDWVPNP